MRKIINILLIIFGIVTLLVPITGVNIHKISSSLFFILVLIHLIINFKKMNYAKWLMLCLLVLVFTSGVLNFIEIHNADKLHTISSIVLYIVIGIHIFIYKKIYK